ncbi:bacteriocin-like peptide, LSEI_2386 family [Lacticaseibacillus paracasei]|jgi:hypothetical protein|uniref:bacteriocin-like peptide, LSEI_2386 family n=1 Tax=Lacticaseibacillus paracasei TaxID=1597 RepID=UPI000FF515E0|nr:hypothetical protein [Lacticaseibacillus paracasei]MCU6432081.1 hypothetical protein [Lacticaseibacillus paracasei]RND46031.1 hypothetical protein FAM18110_02284 [Lacticaseibacillus paracasei]
MNNKKNDQKKGENGLLTAHELEQVRGGDSRLISEPYENLKRWIGSLFRGKR